MDARTSSSAPPVLGLHLQFGADAAREVVVSWWSPSPVEGARVEACGLDGHATVATAASRSYTDARSGQVVHTHHAHLTGLHPGTAYRYVARHDGAPPERGGFRTGPHGRAPLTFTCFGDQGVPPFGTLSTDVGRPPVGLPLPGAGLGSPCAAGNTVAVERLDPLFHLLVGDLSYANLADDRVATWARFWENNTRSARNRPWMTAAGNHENERGNGPLGYTAYQAFVEVPEAGGQTPVTRGLWYAFTAGSVRVVVLNGDDLVLQDGGDSYIHGYSGGAQLRWLDGELAAARLDPGVDWVVVAVHQTSMSTADRANGADLGLRRDLLPLLDRHDVDLVLCGHEHHFERSHPIRGHASTATRTPFVVATDPDRVDATRGTVHLLVGGGGTSAPTHNRLLTPPRGRVITAVGPVDETTGRRPSRYVLEAAPWLAYRNTRHPWGFATLSVDPGHSPGDRTTLTVTYRDVLDADGTTRTVDTFSLTRPRSDGTPPERGPVERPRTPSLVPSGT